jgi:hypothetical protein
MFVRPKSHTRQNFKYELEDSFWFRAIETKKIGMCSKNIGKDLLFSCVFYYYVFLL